MNITNTRLDSNSAFRTERLIRLLDAIITLNEYETRASGATTSSSKSRILCIGPRNESELLLFRIMGYKNVEGSDLISYSPLIRVMDMHDLKYEESRFDVVFSCMAIGKASDFNKVAQGIIRVARPGAYVALSDGMNPIDPIPVDGNVEDWSMTNYPTKVTPFSNGVSDVHQAFGDHVGEIFWSHQTPPEGMFTTVFRIRK